MGHLEVNPSRTPEPLFGRHVVGIRIMHAGELARRRIFSLIPLSFRRFEASASVIRRADRPPLRDMQGATGVRRFLVDCMEDQKINQNSELTQHTVTAAPSIGAFVQLKNLHNQPELNGAVGNVIGAQLADVSLWKFCNGVLQSSPRTCVACMWTALVMYSRQMHPRWWNGSAMPSTTSCPTSAITSRLASLDG